MINKGLNLTLSRALSIIIFSAYHTPPAVAENACVTPEEAVNAAILNNGQVESAKWRTAEAQASLSEVKASSRPQFSVFARGGAGSSQLQTGQLDNQMGAQLNQRIYDFGKSKLQKNRARAEISAAQFEEKSIRRSLRQEILQLLADSDFAKQRIKLDRQARERLLHRLKLSDNQLEMGAITISDQSRMAADASLAALRIAEAEELRDVAGSSLETFTRLTGVCFDASSLNTFLPLNAFSSLEAAISITLAEHPDIKRMKREMEATAFELKRNKREWIPDIEVSGFYATTYADDQNAWRTNSRVGLGLNMPLYDGGQLKSRNNQIRSRLNQREAGITELKDNLRRSIRTNWARREAYGKSINAIQIALASTRDLVAAVEAEHEMGSRSLDELLEAYRQETTLQTQLIEKKLDRYAALIRLQNFD